MQGVTHPDTSPLPQKKNTGRHKPPRKKKEKKRLFLNHQKFTKGKACYVFLTTSKNPRATSGVVSRKQVDRWNVPLRNRVVGTLPNGLNSL